MLFSVFADSPIKRIVTGDGQTIDADKYLLDFENELHASSMFYHGLNMNITKIRGNLSDLKSFKAPDINWNHQLEEFYDTKQPTRMLLEENWFRASGIGLVLGWNHYHAIDVDDVHPFYCDDLCPNKSNTIIAKMVENCLELLGLPQNYPWVINSGSRRGFHIIFKSEVILDDTIGSIAYSPNNNYLMDYGTPERVFQRMELRWRDHLILPPSIHKSGIRYIFYNGELPRSFPATISIASLDKMITHFCGRVVFSNYNFKQRHFEIVELGKYYAKYDSWSYDPEHKDDNVSWLKHCNTPESFNTLGIKYILGRGVQEDKKTALNYFLKSKCDFAYFNLASLYACDYFSGCIEIVELFLSKIKNDSKFLKTSRVFDKNRNSEVEYDKFFQIRENAMNFSRHKKLYMFFDTETTGLPKKNDAPSSNTANWPRLVQLSWLICDDEGNIYFTKEYIIKPDGFIIPTVSSEIHGITTDIARIKGKGLSSVLEEFKEDCSFVQSLVGHNIDFDKKVIGAELIRLGQDDIFLNYPSICTMKSTVDFCKIRNFPFGYKYPTLQELYKKLFGKPFEDAHNATSDINATFECFWELRKRGLISIS